MSTTTPTTPTWDASRLREAARDGAALVAAHGEGHDYITRVELSEAVLRWASNTFGEGLTTASSMGDEALVHLVGRTIGEADVFFLDTGYHFPETLATRDHYAQHTPVSIRTIEPLQSLAEREAALADWSPERCCSPRKVEQLNLAVAGRTAWVTGMRRVDAPTRTDIEVVSFDEKRQMVKINPLAAWDDDDLETYLFEYDVHLNPLRQQGYASIGCAPCTRPVAPGEDARAGRWAGQAKTECGLHT
ncbi:phosphoadenylyl-sulfate reductase [Auraticoccus sp. F435]|uniref:Adenosine 5'-phosphosulfate reductase n=1 Tax=Auraticoccus cholistanensis TaxID=2656650 RepID=A0A6A9UYB8_9ACTN|nr:phosphoadenylyl-sulfate reductase [Auraticoccus cholistanensis]MVA76744.1 phosphoadenylyl-sulfate reductase [Auraticoccus cholistanensis]